VQPDETSGSGRVPRATYRIQFSRDFTFLQAADLVPYLCRLGISDLYASPYLQARPGSTHGYDITNHDALNPEIGSEADHLRLSAVLREHGMGHLLDVVPNHMSVAGGTNPWWMNVLENGPSSPFARYFDIDWHPRREGQQGKVLLPVLGDQFGAVLERGELCLVYDDGQFRIDYFEHWFPAAPGSTAAVLRDAMERLGLERSHPERMELESIVCALERLPPLRSTDADDIAERNRERIVTRRRLRTLHEASEPVREAIGQAVREFNGAPGDPRSFDRLAALLDEQAYRLAFWRVAAEEINYRRFFDVNELAGIRVEIPQVFQDTHRLILRLVREGRVTGLRVDHPDGLFHPRDYLRRLQQEMEDEGGYVLVEKILTGDETLPEDWPVAGTVGYEFLNQVNGLFVDGANAGAMDLVYRRLTGERRSYEDIAYEKKRLILRSALVSELTVLTNALTRIADADRRSRDFTWGALHDALREVIACFPVYRTYVDAEAGAVSERDRAYVDAAIARARRRNQAVSGSIFDFIRAILLLDWPEALSPESREEHARFVMKFQQLTGPVTAKGVEDTTFYVFNRLLSLNEVGGEPDRFGVSPDEFHAAMAARAEQWPHAMSASSTHDTKRSEDVRARINVLSEIPDLWDLHVHRWQELNQRHRRVDGEQRPVPDANDEYLLYQTLVGAWPLRPMDADGHAAFVARIQGYMEKATREAKRHTSWINPNPGYDEGLAGFIADLLTPGDNAFLEDLERFCATVAPLGMVNSLAQTLIKLTAPGIPDIYQGQEIWDFSLVDPDNRRPVDFALRSRLLDALEEAEAGDREGLCGELISSWRDGRIKLYLTRAALRLRQGHPELFSAGAYVALRPEGPAAQHLVAFARSIDGRAAITVVPRLVAGLNREHGHAPHRPEAWSGTRLPLSEDLRGRYVDRLSGAELDGSEALPMDQLLRHLPVALLERV
jgi:(1->4)-alpha-D-glucan 1-alpha-D-glucosylmutase